MMTRIGVAISNLRKRNQNVRSRPAVPAEGELPATFLYAREHRPRGRSSVGKSDAVIVDGDLEAVGTVASCDEGTASPRMSSDVAHAFEQQQEHVLYL